MMKILIVQHSWDAPPGFLGERIMARGWRADVFHPISSYAASAPLIPAELPPDDAGYGALAILGGPMDAVDDAHYPHYRSIFRLIDAFRDASKPVFGLCLGAQILARHFGAAVSRMDRMEFGITKVELLTEARSDPLLGGLEPTQRLMEWHRDCFELPPGASALIAGAAGLNQMFRMGASVYACQGHLEATPDTVRRWIFNGRDGLPPDRVPELPEVAAEFERHWEQTRAFAQIVLDRWLDLVSNAAVTS